MRVIFTIFISIFLLVGCAKNRVVSSKFNISQDRPKRIVEYIDDISKPEIKNDIRPIRSHRYITIGSYEELQDINNTITYVLFPKDLRGENKDTEKYKRYKKVLELIQELGEVQKDSFADSSTLDKHYFILMKKRGDNSDKINVESYNYALSKKILDIFAKKSKYAYPFDIDEPIFITVRHHLSENNSFLYFNCNYTGSAIKEAIESYKKRLNSNGTKNVNFMEQLRYDFLALVTL